MGDDARPAGWDDFLQRIIRIIAIVALAHASLHVLSYGLSTVVDGPWWWLIREGLAGRAIELSRIGLSVFLLVASLAMLRGLTWSRAAVMWWAVLIGIVTFASSAKDLVEYASQRTSAARQPVWQIMMWQAVWWIHYGLLPLLIWLVLRQSEVAKRFESRASGGFEVVPMARAVVVAEDGSGTPPG